MTDIKTEYGNSRGCMLTGVLILALLQALFVALFSGLGAASYISEPKAQIIPLIGSIIFFVISVYSIYANIGTFKMKRKAAIGLLVTLGVFLLFYLYVLFSQKPETDEQKAGAGWCILFILVNFVCMAFIGLNFKKMK